MTTVESQIHERAARPPALDQRRARLGLIIWGLLFLNGLAFNAVPMLVPIPGGIGKLITQGSLALATLLVLLLNRDRLVRPNLFLTLYSMLGAIAMLSSLRMSAGLGAVVRTGRLCVFLAVLWLLTPLWGRRDRILLQWHTLCLALLTGSVVVSAVLAPGRSRSIDGRLAGMVWPIPPPQVGHYSALLAGIAFVLFVSGAMRARIAYPVSLVAVAVLLLSHTRTALIGLVVGVLCAMFALLSSRRYARRLSFVALVVLVLAGTVFRPMISEWFSRGQSKEQVGGFNGREKVWDALRAAPRSDFERLVGHGLTDKSFDGHPIDSSWFATYQDEGLVGVTICAAALVCLLMLAATRPRGPSLAVAIFIIVYCAIASTTETGLGDASPYLLDLTVAAALLMSSGGRIQTSDSGP
jgi:hypothetical protein